MRNQIDQFASSGAVFQQNKTVEPSAAPVPKRSPGLLP